VLLTSITLQLCNKIGIIAWFNINQDKVVELFCINKNKPEMDCEGKCYLAQKLNKSADATDNSTAPNAKIKHTIEELFCIESAIQLTIPTVAHDYSFNSYYSLYSHKYLMAVFQPPRA
ncbi:MAG: hypothetical protein KBE91_09195, partial [Bacteroidia bacterium]|nr:hypothetical protein [Bacteroidia bacterium]